MIFLEPPGILERTRLCRGHSTSKWVIGEVETSIDSTDIRSLETCFHFVVSQERDLKPFLPFNISRIFVCVLIAKLGLDPKIESQ